jgi:hypothetical protein
MTQSERRRPAWSTGASAGRRRSCRRRRSGRRPMCRWMPTGLPALSSMKSISGCADDGPSRHLELTLDAASRRPARAGCRRPPRPRAHELDAAAGDDEGLEAVGPQVLEQLEHRLVDHLGVGAVPSSGGGRCPASRVTADRTRRSSCRRGSRRRSSAGPPRRTAASASMSSSSTAWKGCWSCHSGWSGAIAFTRSMAKSELEVGGCSAQRQPSLSKTAMRSAGGTKSGEPDRSRPRRSRGWRCGRPSRSTTGGRGRLDVAQPAASSSARGAASR